MHQIQIRQRNQREKGQVCLGGLKFKIKKKIVGLQQSIIAHICKRWVACFPQNKLYEFITTNKQGV